MRTRQHFSEHLVSSVETASLRFLIFDGSLPERVIGDFRPSQRQWDIERWRHNERRQVTITNAAELPPSSSCLSGGKYGTVGHNTRTRSRRGGSNQRTARTPH